jgi:ABC-type oligopeptide transport system substrate-binding subunit
MKKGILAGFLILALALSIAIVHVNASQVKSTQVDALSTTSLTINLDEGDTFSGSLSISGGSGNDINFKVTNPQGATIVNLGKVSQGATFEFTADDSGAYTFHLDNSFSWLSSKAVSISYDVTHPILGGLNVGSDSTMTFLILGAVVLGVVIVALLAVNLSRNKKTQSTS